MKEFAKALGETVAWPQPGDHRPEAVRAWFGNVSLELEAGVHGGNERVQFDGYYMEAGLLRAWRRPFFWRHYAETLAEATAFLFGSATMPTILDLGCGSGTQSLLFALHGAKVVAADMDPVALRIFRRRLDLYQELCNRTLPVTIVQGNTFELDYEKLGPFDGVYSLFAFNMMQPSAKLVDTLLPHLAVGARWAVLDGNNLSVWNRLLPPRRRRVWSPRDMARELSARGFRVMSQHGGVALPPPVWTLVPYRAARSLDQLLCNSMFWPISCQTLAIRGGR
jgi:SAM-dependent methyltransferase